MPGTMDPFAGAKDENESQKRDLLNAIATGGAAGRKAYEDAQAQVQQSKQGALDRASQRAQMTGQNFGGVDTSPSAATADRFGTYLGAQNANYQSHLGTIGASGESFLSKVNAIHPFMQNQNIQAAADREAQIKGIMEREAAKRAYEQQQADQAHQRDIELIKLRASLDKSGGGSGSSAASNLSIDDLLGYGQQVVDSAPGLATSGQTKILGGPRMAIGPGTPGTNVANIAPKKFDTSTIAAGIGRQLGVPHTESIFSPNKQATIGRATDYLTNPGKATGPTPPPVLDAGFLQGFKMDGKPISAARTQEVLRAPEVGQADLFIRELMNTKIHNGIIDDSSAGDFNGKKPVDAFNTWLDSLPGIKTMKTALRDYYRPWIEQNLRG